MRWLDSITESMDMNLSKLGDSEGQESLALLQSMGSQRVGHDLVTEAMKLKDACSLEERL